MNINQKGFANIILVVVIVILVGVVGYFAFVKKSEPIAQQPTPTLTQTKTPVSPTPTSSATNWKTYRNNAGYQISYPDDYTVSSYGAAYGDKQELTNASSNVTVESKDQNINNKGAVSINIT